ncbi:hypothetical protein As57867_015606, partial [Aphanomyces stellatus]
YEEQLYAAHESSGDHHEAELPERWEIPFTSEDSIEIKYIGSYFQAVTVTGGFTLYPKTNAERLFGGFMFVVGAAANACIFGTCATLMQHMNKVEDDHAHQTTCIHACLRNCHADDDLSSRIMEFYNSAHGVEKAAHNTDELLRGMPEKLHLQLALQLHGEFLRKVPFVKDMASESVLAMVQSMEDVVALKGDLILREGERGQAFFMIQMGTVAVYHGQVDVNDDDDYNEYVLLKRLHAGDYFGEVGLISNKPASANVMATSFCKLQVLYKVAFDSIMEENKRIKTILANASRTRLKQSESMKKTPSAKRLERKESAKRASMSNVMQGLRASNVVAKMLLGRRQSTIAPADLHATLAAVIDAKQSSPSQKECTSYKEPPSESERSTSRRPAPHPQLMRGNSLMMRLRHQQSERDRAKVLLAILKKMRMDTQALKYVSRMSHIAAKRMVEAKRVLSTNLKAQLDPAPPFPSPSSV